MKGKKILGGVLAVALVVVFLFFWDIPTHAGFRWQNSYADTVQKNWGVTLPIEQERLFGYSETSFLGDGPRYHVLQYEDVSQIDEVLAWADTAEEDREWAERILERVCAEKEIPESLFPDYAVCLVWTAEHSDRDRVAIFYRRGEARLYIVENFL